MPGGSLFETFMGMGGGLQLMWFIGVCLTKSWNPAANFVFIVGSNRSTFLYYVQYYIGDLQACHIAEKVVMCISEWSLEIFEGSICPNAAVKTNRQTQKLNTIMSDQTQIEFCSQKIFVLRTLLSCAFM